MFEDILASSLASLRLSFILIQINQQKHTLVEISHGTKQGSKLCHNWLTYNFAMSFELNDTHETARTQSRLSMGVFLLFFGNSWINHQAWIELKIYIVGYCETNLFATQSCLFFDNGCLNKHPLLLTFPNPQHRSYWIGF